ncbi:hypothetical protein CU048_12385 [Beijerinckiaceae bacterium]|nr:hypothetical protein CU048_12385 [Beijerinckiaceae bacterium]
MEKLQDAQGCIVDAQHLTDLVEIVASTLDNREGATISNAVRCAGGKLTRAMLLLEEVEADMNAARAPQTGSIEAVFINQRRGK